MVQKKEEGRSQTPLLLLLLPRASLQSASIFSHNKKSKCRRTCTTEVNWSLLCQETTSLTSLTTSSPENYNVALCREGAVNSVPIVLMSRVVKWAFCECTHHKELASTRRLHVLTDYLVCGALSC